jgi:cell division protein FtsL
MCCFVLGPAGKGTKLLITSFVNVLLMVAVSVLILQQQTHDYLVWIQIALASTM